MGTSTSHAERLLEAARASFPGWDIHPVFAGYLALPKGTPLVQAIDIDGLVGKLRREEDQ